jgi:hypothetical protein
MWNDNLPEALPASRGFSGFSRPEASHPNLLAKSAKFS